MGDFERILDEMFTLGFTKPKDIRFKTGYTQDMNPCCWSVIKDEKGNKTGYRAICRAVGVNEQDISIELLDDEIHVKGETKFTDKSFGEDNYYFDYYLPVVPEVVANMKNIKYKALNGLLYIFVEINEPKRKEIKIEKI